MERDVLLVRYETLAANRRHFEVLFFATVAFSWCFALASWAAIAALAAGRAGVASIAAGAILLGGAFIAHRLMLRERSAFDAMAASWRALVGEQPADAPRRARPGAMAVAAAGQGVAGLLAVVAGAAGLQ